MRRIEESTTDSTSKEMTDRSFGYPLSILGFGLCRAWIILCLSAALPGMSYTDSWIYLLAGAAAALAVVFVVPRLRSGLIPRQGRSNLRLFKLSGALLLVSALGIPLAGYIALAPVMALAMIVGGLGAGLLQVLWGERFCAHGQHFSVMVAPAAAVLTAVVVMLSLGEAARLGIVMFPLVSFFLLMLDIDRKKGIEVPEQTASRVDVPVWKLMFSILVFSFICRAFDYLPIGNHDILWFFGGSTLFSLVIVGVTFLLLAVLLKGRFNIALTYRLSLPIMVMGIAVLAFFLNTSASLSLLLINIGYEFFDILSWILFAQVSRRKQGSALRVFGVGVAFTFIGMALAYLLGGPFIELITNGDTQIAGIALLGMVALVMVLFLLVPEGTIQQLAGPGGEAERSGSVDEGDAGQRGGEGDIEEEAGAGIAVAAICLEQNCRQAAETFGLTSRESEVLLLLARGRTLVIIARDLQIARGTARTHIERVYQKLNVHKQQELIDLVEGDFVSAHEKAMVSENKPKENKTREEQK